MLEGVSEGVLNGVISEAFVEMARKRVRRYDSGYILLHSPPSTHLIQQRRYITPQEEIFLLDGCRLSLEQIFVRGAVL